MRYPHFELEHYLAEREFTARYNLCGSDLETWSLAELLQMADPEALALWQQLRLHYTEPQGLPLLRAEIAKQYGGPIGPDDLLCFAGAEEGIYCAVQALLTASDHAIVVTPCYQSLEALPAAICPTTAVPLRYETGWQLDLGEVERAVRSNSKLLLVNFPHNPTGALLTRDEQRELIELARRHDLWIFADEVYRLLEIDPHDRLPPMAVAYEKGVSLGVLSKAYGLAGLRIGWIACQVREQLAEMGAMKHYLSICNSAPAELLGLIALRASETILTRNRELMQGNLALVDRFMKRHEEQLEWVRPKGGCIGFPRWKGRLSAEQLADRLLKERGALILPGQVYGYPGSHFRLSFGRQGSPDALRQLDSFIEEVTL